MSPTKDSLKKQTPKEKQRQWEKENVHPHTKNNPFCLFFFIFSHFMPFLFVFDEFVENIFLMLCHYNILDLVQFF